MDSNHDSQIQSLLSCRWTTGDYVKFSVTYDDDVMCASGQFSRISAFASIPGPGDRESNHGRSSSEAHGRDGGPETISTPASLRCSSTSKSTVRWIVYKGSGGLAHMLGGLSDAIKIAKRTQRHLVIDCQSAGAFQNSFDQYFYIEDEELSYSCSTEQLPDSAVYQGRPVKDFEEVPVIWKQGDKKLLRDIKRVFRHT